MGQRVLVVAAVSLMSPMLVSLGESGQTSSASAPPLVVTASNGAAPGAYASPRTSWGEPDLQGVWSSDDTSMIPLSRPQRYGNRLYQNDQEFAARVKQVEGGVRNAETATCAGK